jgi:hypothetical protein
MAGNSLVLGGMCALAYMCQVYYGPYLGLV